MVEGAYGERTVSPESVSRAMSIDNEVGLSGNSATWTASRIGALGAKKLADGIRRHRVVSLQGSVVAQMRNAHSHSLRLVGLACHHKHLACRLLYKFLHRLSSLIHLEQTTISPGILTKLGAFLRQRRRGRAQECHRDTFASARQCWYSPARLSHSLRLRWQRPASHGKQNRMSGNPPTSTRRSPKPINLSHRLSRHPNMLLLVRQPRHRANAAHTQRAINEGLIPSKDTHRLWQLACGR
jgi:hypothetical protein